MMAAGMLVLYTMQLFIGCALSQNNLYSLQPAVDALHRREAQLWLDSPHTFKHNNNYNAEDRQQLGYGRLYGPDETDDLDDEPSYVEQSKRSIFRERGDAPRQSAFRERDSIQPELAAQFMEAIDHERAVERDQHYKEQLHRLWQKYQQQENDLEEELFENDNEPSDIRYQYGPPTDDERLAAAATAAVDDRYAVAEKRRLVMPWLPVSKRSYPMSKRSSAPYAKQDASISGTDEKVARDLQAIFAGSTSGADRVKSKRSSRAERTAVTDVAHQTTTSTSTVKPLLVSESKEEHAHQDTESKSVVSHQRDQHDNHDLDHDGYLEEHEHDHEHDHEHEDEHDHEHDEDEDDSVEDHDESSDKKKRAAINKVKRGNQEVLKEDQIIPGDLTDFKRKKSVEWSKYFGIDRRKKSTEWATAEKPKSLEDYAPTHFRNHDQVVARPKLEVNEKKLENMDHKLKSIEELIIDETIKYNAEHEGITNPDDIQKLRDHVISRLATAYSLEKMRRALEKLKQSVDLERHLSLNEFDDAHKAEDESAEAQDKNKRVAIKKEKVQYENNQHNIDSVTEHMFNGNGMMRSNSADNEDLPHKSQDKKASYAPMMTMPHENHHKSANNPPMLVSYNKRPSQAYDSILEQYTPIEEYSNNAVDDECPLLDAMEKRCRAVNLLSGDIRQQFLPQCGIHQLCYLCGTSESECDYQYAAKAGTVCGNNEECHVAARTALMILRESTGPQMGPRECARNSCLRRALIEIGAM